MTVVALGLAAAARASAVHILLVGLAVGSGQLSIGWSNDWIDHQRGRDVGRSDKPTTGGLRVEVVRRAAWTAVGLCVVFSVLLGPAAAVVHLVAVVGGWAYNVWFKATALSVVPYLLSFGLLPSVATMSADGVWAPWWGTVTAACFGAGVHFANVLPDLESDQLMGVRGLPQRIGYPGSAAATIGFLGFGVAVVLLAAPGLSAVLAAVAAVGCTGLLTGVAVAARTHQAELAFKLSMVTGLVLVGLLVAGGARLT